MPQSNFLLRNKLLLALLVVFLGWTAVNLFQYTRKEISNIDSKGSSIVCFGNSVTLGYGVRPGEEYPAVLAKMTGLPVVNAGVDGDTTVRALERLERDVLSRDPLLVIIEFCGNDFLKKIPHEQTLANLKEMIERIQDAGAMTAIADISAGMFMRAYRLDYANLARQTRSIFIPAVLDKIITNPSMKSDFLHPNSDGYKVVALRVYREIIPCLNRNAIIRKFGKKQ